MLTLLQGVQSLTGMTFEGNNFLNFLIPAAVSLPLGMTVSSGGVKDYCSDAYFSRQSLLFF